PCISTWRLRPLGREAQSSSPAAQAQVSSSRSVTKLAPVRPKFLRFEDSRRRDDPRDELRRRYVKAGIGRAVLDRNPEQRDGCSFGNAGLVVPSHFVPLALGLKWRW